MKVETFEIQEVTECGVEQAELAKELAEQLGLSGQQQFYNGEHRTICPYRKMTAQEKVVYETLLPRKTELESYADSPIPIRVLQVAQHAKEAIQDCTLYVWHPANADDRDPLLVAIKKNPDITYETWFYILARWGEELDEWTVLLERAKKVIAAEAKASLMKIKTEIDVALPNIEVIVESKLLKGERQAYSFYGF